MESVNLWVERSMALLAPPADWEPSAAVARARIAAAPDLRRAPRRYWLMGAVAATAFGAVMIVNPNMRALAEQCWQCITVGRTETAREVRKHAPDFALRDANGQLVRLSDYKGKVVLLDFWATWCPPCAIEVPWFAEFQRKYKDRGFEVLGVALDDDGWTSVQPFVARKGINYRIVLGDEKTSREYGGVESLPTTFVIDREGRIAATHVGLTSRKAFEEAIEKSL